MSTSLSSSDIPLDSASNGLDNIKTDDVSSQKRRIRHLPTLQGLVLLLFGISMVIGPASQHSDLIAAVVGYSLIILVPAMSIATLLTGWRMCARIQLRPTYGVPQFSTSSRPTSEHPFSLFIRLSEIYLPPLFSVSLTPHFLQEQNTATWKVAGDLGKGKELMQLLEMPHRGQWSLSHIECALQDTLGLSKFSWQVNFHPSMTIPVYPPVLSPKEIPIFTSDTTSGVEQVELQNRGGDLFDVKRYHPADGARKILWKVYAKSGELLARHPEPSMRPEGTISALVLAGKNDDALCSTVISYLRVLEEEGFEFLLAADGWQESDTAHTGTATSSSQAEEVLLAGVWQADVTTTEERMRNVASLSEHQAREHGSRLNLLTVFVSVKRLSNPEFMAAALELQTLLNKQHLDSFWIILDAADRQENEKSSPLLERIIFRDDEGTEKTAPNDDAMMQNAREQFLSECEKNNVRFTLVQN